MSDLMQAFQLKRYGKSPTFALQSIPRPVPKPDEILIKVHAAGLNPVDNMIASGAFKPMLPYRLPLTLGSDIAGVVMEVGSRVTRFNVGDAIFASTFSQNEGALAEFITINERLAVLKPENLSFEAAASVPMVALTTWQALAERAGVRAGTKVFIPAGAGGIGTFAIQLAKHLGAHVATTTSTANVDFVRALGADHVINYKVDNFAEKLQNYDVVLGTLGGDELKKSLKIVKAGSRVVSLVGPPDAAFARARRMNGVMRCVFGLLSRNIIHHAKKRGAEYSFLFVQPNGEQLAHIATLLATETIRPVIDKVFPFAETKAALAYLQTGRAKGKVVVRLL